MTTSVLIVEDEPSILELISYTCRTSGMEVRKAANVAEAKKILKRPNRTSFFWTGCFRTAPALIGCANFGAITATRVCQSLC